MFVHYSVIAASGMPNAREHKNVWAYCERALADTKHHSPLLLEFIVTALSDSNDTITEQTYARCEQVCVHS